MRIVSLAGGLLALASGLAAFLSPTRARASEPAYFYCYVPNPAKGETYVSDVHPVGPLHERGRYGPAFVDFLQMRGMIGIGREGYCTMRATLEEIQRGRRELRQMGCTECANAKRLQDVVWARPGDPKLSSFPVGGEPRLDPMGDIAHDRAIEKAKRDNKPEEEGAWLRARVDTVDVAGAVNEVGAEEKVMTRSAGRGGKWRWLLQNDRCPGWIAVAFAERDSGISYYVTRGKGSETEARNEARRLAAQYDTASIGQSGIIFTADNQVKEPGLSLQEHIAMFEGGPISAAKAYIRRLVYSPCPSGGTYTTVGVRG